MTQHERITEETLRRLREALPPGEGTPTPLGDSHSRSVEVLVAFGVVALLMGAAVVVVYLMSNLMGLK